MSIPRKGIYGAGMSWVPCALPELRSALSVVRLVAAAFTARVESAI
jgi:hypothetical protein